MKKSLSKSNERKIGAVLSYVQMALSIITGLLYTPLMIRLMGQEEYGLYGTVSSFVSMLGLLDLGFTSSYVKYFTKYRIENEYDKLNGFNSLFSLVFLVISVIAAALGILFSFNLDWIFSTGLTSAEYEKARIMVILLTVSVALGFLTNVFTSYISANQKFVFTKTFGLATTILTVVVNIAVLMLHGGAVGLVCVSLVFSIITKIVYIFYAFKNGLKFSIKNIPKGVFKEVFVFSGLIAVNMIVDKVNLGIDSVLLGRFCGTATVAIYTVGASINSHFTNFSTAISGIFTPHVHELVCSHEMDSQEQRDVLTAFFTKVGRIQFLLLGLILSGFVIFGRQFVYLWAGEGYDDAYYIALLLMGPSIIPLIQNVGIEIQRAENRHHYRSVIYGLTAILNFAISIFLCQIWGGIGSATGTAIATLIANCLIMNIVYHKKINIDMISFWKSILKQFAGMLPAILIGVVVFKFIDTSTILSFILGVIAYVIVYCAFVWKFSMNDYEQNLIKSVLKKVKRK